MAAGPSQPAWPRGCGQLSVESCCAAPSPSTPSHSEWHSLLHGARRAVHRSSSCTNVGKRVGESEAPIFGLQWIGSRLQQVNYVSGHGDLCPTRASTGYGATSLRCVCCSNAHTHSSPRISTPPRSRAARNAPAVKRSFVRARCRWTPPPWRPSE